MNETCEIKYNRLFLGTYIDPDIVYSNNINELGQYLNCSMKLVERENIHLTWKFIGDIESDKTDIIVDLIKNITVAPLNIEIKLQDFEIWPNGKYPRQLVITGIDINGNGACLYKELNNRLSKIGIKKEKRSFNPHITVARFRIKQKPAEPIILPNWLKFQEATLKFSTLDLIQSTLTPKGSIYNIIQSFKI